MKLYDILKAHGEKYPDMQPQDVVKLLYQSEFGGEYIKDSVSCSLQRLKQEVKLVTPNGDIELFEPIGSGFMRVNLAALPSNNVSVYTLDALYMLSTKLYHGSKESLMDKLEELRQFQKATQMFSFSDEELSLYVQNYIDNGCPMIPHSGVYKQKYRPAYRVIHEELLKLYVFET